MLSMEIRFAFQSFVVMTFVVAGIFTWSLGDSSLFFLQLNGIIRMIAAKRIIHKVLSKDFMGKGVLVFASQVL